MKNTIRAIIQNINSQPPIFIAIIAVFAFSLISRFVISAYFLPYYSLDENDIVEYALGFFGGDKDPHWYKYGPLYWYILYYVFQIKSFFMGMGGDAFVEHYFTDSTPYFIAARRMNSIIHIVLGFISYLICYKHFNKKAAPYVLLLSIFLFPDILTNYYPRVDSLLALNVLLALYFSFFWLKKRTAKHLILTGIFLGLAIASKPIPSLLVFPIIALTYILSFFNKKSKQEPLQTKAQKAIFNYDWIIVLIAILVAYFISSPYSFYNFDAFWQEQVTAVKTEGSLNFRSGSDLSMFTKSLGYIFTIASILALGYSLYDGIKRKKWQLALIALYILLFWLAFAAGASRNYFYIPIIPLLTLLIAYTIHRLLYLSSIHNNKVKLWIKLGFALLLFIQPMVKIAKNQYNYLSSKNTDTFHTIISGAMPWIENNIPVGSKILYYGYYTSLPRLIDNNINEQARYGDYFMYKRNQNKYWIQRFSVAMAKYIESGGKTYDIVFNLSPSINGQKKAFYTRYKSEELERYIFDECRNQGINYIVSVYDLETDGSDFKKVGSFESKDFNFGARVYIYQQNE